MTEVDHRRAHCMFCSWSDRTHRYPYHIIRNHPEKIILCDVQHDHCIRGSIANSVSEVFFAACLTCKKGTVSETYCGPGLRWMSMHGRSAPCRAAHAAAYAVLTERRKGAAKIAELNMALETFKAEWLITHTSSADPIPTLLPVAPAEPEPIPTLVPVEPEPIPALVPAETPSTDTAGWVYCFENDAMPGMYKVGVTRRTPTQRLAEANSSNTWVPSPFRIVMSKHTADAFATEKWLHQRLSEMGFRVNRRREFFSAPLTVLQPLFDQVEGVGGHR